MSELQIALTHLRLDRRKHVDDSRLPRSLFVGSGDGGEGLLYELSARNWLVRDSPIFVEPDNL